MIISARVDQSFPVEGVRAVYHYGRELYQSSGEGARIGYFEDAAEGHGYQKAKREAAYGWFLRWLLNKGDGSPVPEPPPKTEDFRNPEKFAAGPGIVEAAKRITDKAPPDKLPADWRRNLGEPLPKGSMTVRLTEEPIQQIMFETQPGLSVPATVYRPGEK